MMIYLFEKISYNHSLGIIFNDGVEYKLTKIQRKLLKYLLDNPQEIISKQVLMDEVWERTVTENSIDQRISNLRSYIEPDPTHPKIIVTNFGQGFSLNTEVTMQCITPEPDTLLDNKTKARFFTPRLILLCGVILSLLAAYFLLFNPEENQQGFSLNNQKMLILPMAFDGENITPIEQQGVSALIQSTFKHNQDEGRLLFDGAGESAQLAIEKHWKLENDLIIMHSNVIKNGEIYQASIELSDGVKTITETTLTAPSLNDLINKQIIYISNVQQLDTDNNLSNILKNSNNPIYIEALGYQKSGNINKAKTILKQILVTQEDHAQARLTLAKILLSEKKLDESLAQLNTLKSMQAYQFFGAEIELDLAEINFLKGAYQEMIDNLKNYQANNLSISELKKAKIKIKIANGYIALGELQSAYEFYQKAVLNVDQQHNPNIYAQSYYGQGRVRQLQANDSGVYELFDKSLLYAKAAKNIHSQILALNEMSHILLTSFRWDEAAKMQKQSLQIMELDNNKHQVSTALATLTATLLVQGKLKEAKEVNDRLGVIAKDLASDSLQLVFLHYDAILALNNYDLNYAEQQIDQYEKLAIASKNYKMLLNNSFAYLELLLLRKDTINFENEWNKRVTLIKELGFNRHQIYMDLYLARYYILLSKDSEAIAIINDVSEQAKNIEDIKILVDAQNHLAEIYIKTDPQRALNILYELEQHHPHPNPYLELKAQALFKLDKSIEALSVMNHAKLVYHDSWKTKNQALLETLQKAAN